LDFVNSGKKGKGTWWNEWKRDENDWKYGEGSENMMKQGEKGEWDSAPRGVADSMW
jgi:hypothetical protein